MHDLVIIGAGPAGRALGAACHARGLDVICVDPAPHAPWPNNYGAWADAIEPLGLAHHAAIRWSRAMIHVDATRAVTLDRPYVNLDGRALQASMAVPLLDGVVRAADAEAVHLEDGRTLSTRLVVDAAGATNRFSSRRGHDAPGFQRAYGLDLEVKGHDFDLDTMQLMDFRSAPEAEASPASFVYVMPHGPGRLFVEETSLVGRPAIDLDLLEVRLRARMTGWGLSVVRERAVERCHIPMGGALPDFAAPILSYGAAAGLTHPATGYQLTHALRCAAPAADALVAGLQTDADTARGAFWAAVWPREKQRLWQLFRFGMEILLRLDQAATQRFFGGFFALEPKRQAQWLAGTMTVKEASAAMTTVFGQLPWGLRARLIGHGMLPHGWRMFGALLG